ncbi:hypothetical protein FS837_002435 [Tulasnella sp. UAMH 9824]|nr:hypothetical protein FS837_002435 [Tulasnella sp. UAMH 9824]
MDTRLQQLADFKAAFNDSVHRDAVKHVRHRNTLLPIATLPPELLQAIWTIVLFSPRGRRKDRFVWRLTTLRAVSWSWRNLIGQTPSFWAHVSSEDHIDFISEALERSDQVPIHLKHIGAYRDGLDSSFFNKVLPHAHRWESVAIHQPNADVARNYFSVSAPNIKTILLSSLVGGTYKAGSIGSLFGADLANLEELRVDMWGVIDWRGVCCTRLRILDIERGRSCDMGTIFDILASNPHLEILQELALTDVTQPTEDSFSRSHTAIGNLLRRIRLRIGIDFSMRTQLERGSPLTPKSLINLIPNPAEALTHLSRMDGFQRAHVDVKFEGENLLFRIRDTSRSNPVFSAAVNGLPPEVAKEWVVESLRQASATPVDLRLYFGSPEDGSGRPDFSLEEVFYFQLWESVVDLTLKGKTWCPPDIGQDILRLISTPCISEDGLMVMPFPKLQHLRISYVSGMKAKHVLAMVQARFASPGSTEAEVPSHSTRPVPLTIHCGDELGDWVNSPMIDKILAVPGLEGIRRGISPWIPRSSSPISSEPEWPPPYDFGSSRRR